MCSILIEPNSIMPCILYMFKINDINAEIEDFGVTMDIDNDDNELGCTNHSFIKKDIDEYILNKYQINIDEYDEICNELARNLNIGTCGACS